MNNLGLYIKMLLKTRNIKLFEFEKMMNTTKTIMYRILIGETEPTNEWLDKVASVLSLNEHEIRDLRYSSSLYAANQSIPFIRQEIYDLLYTENKPSIQDIDFIFYSSQQLAKTYSSILLDLQNLSNNDDFKCSIKIVNCLNQNILLPLFNFSSNLQKSDVYYEIEHLTSFSKENQLHSLNTLKNILLLLALKDYSVKYNDNSYYTDNVLFHNTMNINYSFTDSAGNLVDETLFLSFSETGFSTCYHLKKPDLGIEFFSRNYLQIANTYPHNLKVTSQSLFEYNESVTSIETNDSIYVLCPSPSYNKIPLEIYEEVYSNLTDDEQVILLNTLFNFSEQETLCNLSNLKETLFSNLAIRVNSSISNYQTDIYTTSGLKQFALTGILSDHKKGLPPFTPSQRKVILENILKKSLNINDKSSFYIIETNSRSDILNNNMYPLLSSSGKILFDFNIKQNEHLSHIYSIEIECISELLLDFVENYVIPFKSMTKDDAHNFIKNLINHYCT